MRGKPLVLGRSRTGAAFGGAAAPAGGGLPGSTGAPQSGSAVGCAGASATAAAGGTAPSEEFRSVPEPAVRSPSAGVGGTDCSPRRRSMAVLVSGRAWGSLSRHEARRAASSGGRPLRSAAPSRTLPVSPPKGGFPVAA
ncbi:hypothetical protein Aros01_09462 [Streptosporangium roseum]